MRSKSFMGLHFIGQTHTFVGSSQTMPSGQWLFVSVQGTRHCPATHRTLAPPGLHWSQS